MEKLSLNSGWIFKLNPDSKNHIKNYSKIKNKNFKAEVPGTIHTDLLKNNLIEEPFYSDNELRLQWISELDWTYEKLFNYNDKITGKEKIVFEGIDTISEIYLNGGLLGKTNNMFIRYEFPISKFLKAKGNLLKVVLKSPTKYAMSEENKYGKLPVALNSYRAYIRKAQYSFGWDWGPVFATSGIWKDVFIDRNYKPAIEKINFDTLKLSENNALIYISFQIKNKPSKIISAKIRLNINNNETIYSIKKCKINNEYVVELASPELWWCNGYGNQNLYDLEIELFDKEKNLIDKTHKKIGIRKIESKLTEDQKNVFYFVLNGKKIFSKGVNWIPGDAFLNRITDEKYRNLLQYAKDGNMNIVRVWGGGIYENDKFYELCDEMGLMVWQDFMFACGAYPEHKEFLKNVKTEIIENVNRLQYHPSIVIWCGNNENEWNWTKEQFTHYKNMPGYKIFSKLIPEIVNFEDPNRSYWESSPFSLNKDPNSQTSGNRHQWDVWSNWIDYTEVIKDNSLFVTEFGFQGTANLSTLNKFIPKDERKIHGEIFEFHNKQTDGNQRIIRFISAHLPLNCTWEGYNYLSQLNQGFALKTCLEHWRYNQITSGSVIWQINDTNPVTSWALIDSELMPKMAYHFVKNSFAPITHRIEKQNNNYSLSISNHSGYKINCKAVIMIYDTVENAIKKNIFKRIIIEKHSQITVNLKQKEIFANGNEIIISSLYDKNELLHRNYFIEKEWKYLNLIKAKVKITKIPKDKYIITTDVAAFFVDLVAGDNIFQDRGFILLPGEEKQIKLLNKGKRIPIKSIVINTLNDFLSRKK